MKKTFNIFKFAEIIQNKSNARQFLYDAFEKKKKTILCPHCRCKDYYTMSKSYLRCTKCRNDYNPFYGTWIYEIRIDAVKWIALIKLFEIGTSARRASIEIEISYPTALAAFDCMRYAILHNLMKTEKSIKGKFELDAAYFGGKCKGNRGRGAKNKTIVFGILERKDTVRVEIVKNVKANTLLKNTLKKMKRGSIVYTDKWKGYDSLAFSGYRHLTVDRSKIFA